MTIDTFVNIPGNLRDACNAAVPGTLRHVDELMTERRSDVSLRNLGFYTPDGELYFMDGNKPTLAMTREADNLVLRHIDDAFAQLTSGGNYHPSVTEATSAIKASATEIFDLNELKLKRYDDEFSAMAVSTTKYDQLSPEQRRLAERVYGKGDDFVLNMAMLKQAGIDTTRVYVLNLEYVKEHAKGSSIGRASWLNDFEDNSSFNAIVRSVNSGSRVRGVRRGVIAEGARNVNEDHISAQKTDPRQFSCDALKNAVPSAPVAPSEIRTPTLAETLAVSRQYVPDVAWNAFEVDLKNLYKP